MTRKKEENSSLSALQRAIEAEKDLSPSRLKSILREANIQATDLEPWADYEHSPNDSYGRQLVWQDDRFEIMVMSWCPGDFSAIHDHGNAQFGAVQIFGPAEHATFRVLEDRIYTLARWTVQPGDIIGISHSLVHQMGNPGHAPFFSLHLYASTEPLQKITGDARIFNLENQTIQRVDGGVFFALPPAAVKRVEPGPPADFPTRLRHQVELIRRLQKMGKEADVTIRDTFSSRHHSHLLRCLAAHTDAADHQSNSIYWRALIQELKEGARLQSELQSDVPTTDLFHQYADWYDALIGRPSLDQFMAGYIAFFRKKYSINLAESSLISLGCGTGLVEQHLIEKEGMAFEQLLGIDLSTAMIRVAEKRIRAEQADLLAFDPDGRKWDIAFSGLNVFHYLDHERLEEAVQKAAVLIKPGGFFLGDFITPDHIRWYPHVVYSSDQKKISLRTPSLVEEAGHLFQESTILNLNFQGDSFQVSEAGTHRRFLPPLHRVRTYFEEAFGGEVSLYDAHSLAPIPEWADSCRSTRYVVVAQKK